MGLLGLVSVIKNWEWVRFQLANFSRVYRFCAFNRKSRALIKISSGRKL